MKFRKKPITIEAVQIRNNGANSDYFNVPEWAKDVCDYKMIWRNGETIHCLEIESDRGNIDVMEGDWLIQGIDGEVYPCKDEIFQKTYEKVEE